MFLVFDAACSGKAMKVEDVSWYDDYEHYYQKAVEFENVET